MAMESYRSYMDKITVSDTLHGRLMRLQAVPAKKQAPLWLRMGAAAACAALLLSAGAYGLTGLLTGLPPAAESAEVSSTALASGTIDLIPEDPEHTEPGMKTMGGYETHETRAGVDVVCYHILPKIDYGENTSGEAALRWRLPDGAIQRDLSREEITALLGGDEALTTHLDWSGYDITGWAAWNADGSLWGVLLWGGTAALDHWEMTLCVGQLPPTCVAYEESVEQEIWNISVTADRYDTETGCERRVSFMKNGCGYRFDLTGTDAERAETLVSRFARWVIAEDGIRPGVLSQDGSLNLPPEPDVPPMPSGADGSTAASVPPQNAGG